MSKTILILALLTVAILCQDYKGCKGTPNLLPIIDQKPELVQQVRNGQKFVIPVDGRFYYVLNLTGNAFDMGFAYGTLMRKEIPPMVDAFFSWAAYYLENNISTVIARLPKFIKTFIGKTGVKLARELLNINYLITKKYTEKRWDDEMRGIAEAANIDVKVIRQVNLVPELLKASCSILGAYGKATKSGKTIHLRSLDWEEHAPISKWPTVTVYHSTEQGSYPFANIAWPIFLGSLTGYSSQKIGIGERLGGAAAKDETRFGKPWTYVLRDTLQFSKTQADAIKYLQDAKRTCAIYLGVGGESYFNICEYAATYLRVYDYNTWHHDDQHPVTEDALWKEYWQPECFNDIIQKNYGKIDAELVYRYIAPMAQSGDSQIAVMDYAEDVVYLNYPNPFTSDPSFVRPTVKLDLKPFFNNIKQEEVQAIQY